MPPKTFFPQRMAHDIVMAYYSHPTSWNEIGWGGPASPRGYVRMDFDRARSLGSGRGQGRRRSGRTPEEPPCRMTPLTRRGRGSGRAPDVFEPGAWMPMREYREDEAVDFVIVGTGAGGGTLACKLAEAGFSVVALDAGPYFRPLEDFASDEAEQTKLYWTDDRICDGEIRCRWAAITAARRWAAARCILRWCRCASGPNGSNRARSWATARIGRSIGARCGATTARSRTR